MAKGNMILTLVARADKFSKGLQDAGKNATGFGGIVKGAMGVAIGAVALLATAVIRFLPDFLKMGEEARKSELRLANIAETMGLFGKNTEKVTKRISDYATKLSFTTGIDDELIRSNEAVLLTFKNLASGADKAGGPFDRAVAALNDLAAAGKDVSAAQLGKAMEDPIGGLTALRRAGVMFNEEQKKTIQNFVDTNNLAGAQDYILSSIEHQVGGTAEAMASNTDKMAARFEDLAERASGALLPAVDAISQKFADWMDSPQGKKFIEDFVKQFEDFGKWIAGPDGQKAISDLVEMFKIMLATVQGIVAALQWIGEWIGGPNYAKLNKAGQQAYNLVGPSGPQGSGWSGNMSNLGNTTGTNLYTSGQAKAPVVVNVTGITPSATIGGTVMDAVKNAQRMGLR